MKSILNGEKISLTECRRILNVNGNNYSDEQLLIIRNWIYQVAEITLEFLDMKNAEELQEIKRLLSATKCSKKKKSS